MAGLRSREGIYMVENIDIITTETNTFKVLLVINLYKQQ